MRALLQYRSAALFKTKGNLPHSGLRYPAEPALDKASLVLADRCPLLRSLHPPPAALPSQASSAPSGHLPPGGRLSQNDTGAVRKIEFYAEVAVLFYSGIPLVVDPAEAAVAEIVG